MVEEMERRGTSKAEDGTTETRHKKREKNKEAVLDH